ncbi:MAG TPA: bifunctional phosphopantothenoylcysteine decarboxylase/phosphopantothenate--cysteine ligase CoaBC [Kiritimatiellia bacterium]|nr:bifunctional phosphopantothenoylcysteine decarboxylase/phosphopantothenate--cysteine ligase CoaBC [Kiritimatiellia bacterium]HMP35511.1 bifunctional phosphopantothenoylcysteine decarboxylase/phosphopantothenate--cysteine ligase CoaBC [Kiritimatiellia bacterium]
MNQAPSSLGSPLVLLGVCGGISAYKSVDLASRLKKAGLQVHVVMTEAATRFVAPLSFEAVSGHRVNTSVFPAAPAEHPEHSYPHLYPATRANVCIIAPATADAIARLAHGFGSDAVTTSALSLPASCRRYFAPAMNVEMWHQPVVQQNVAKLEALGWQRIGPDSGELACGMVGEGRMAEPATIADVITVSDPLSPGGGTPGPLSGATVLILSGPTCEHLDPIRFISNASSGKMGKALAEQAAQRGARVVFVTGPVPEANLPRHPSVVIERVVSAEDLLAAGRRHFTASDVVVYAAAVADYRPAQFTTEKMPKRTGRIELVLEATPDVAATLNRDKKPGQVAVGFALQTHDGEQRALEKMRAKQFDGIVLNAPDALGGNDGAYTFFDARDAAPQAWGKLVKSQCAARIFDFVASRRRER